MDIVQTLQEAIIAEIDNVFGSQVGPEKVIIQPTKPDFEGDYTLVTFGLSKVLGKAPPQIAESLGSSMKAANGIVADYNVIKGFLNLKLSDNLWREQFERMKSPSEWWRVDGASEMVVVEYASPNTNKPLHLGHVRNLLLGWSISRILEEVGHPVVKVQIINDRGIAICKSMLAWQLFAGGQTPAEAGVKPDHFVGDWYVRFEQEFANEYLGWQTSDEAEALFSSSGFDDRKAFFSNYKNTYFNERSPLGRQARNMLLDWEAGDEDVLDLWRQMNGWVYQGFDETYERLGVSFDKLYYESETYLEGKSMVNEGLEKGVFYRRDDGSVWVDLEDVGMDQKIILRSDGTSVYLTQDLGTAELRYKDFGADRMIYVVADEQNYHFTALFESLKKLNKPYADGLYHLSYGLVELPSGRMKTREGKVVDADDLMDEVYAEAQKAAAERGEVTGLSEDEQHDILRKISLGALKYHIIKVEPKKRMIFNPEESVDLQGQTGPYVQNAFVRIRSILRKADRGDRPSGENYRPVEMEKELLRMLDAFSETIRQAAEQYNPGHLANYCYALAKAFHRYYHDYRILNAETDDARAFRLEMIRVIARVLERGMDLLGIEMPDRM